MEQPRPEARQVDSMRTARPENGQIARSEHPPSNKLGTQAPTVRYHPVRELGRNAFKGEHDGTATSEKSFRAEAPHQVDDERDSGGSCGEGAKQTSFGSGCKNEVGPEATQRAPQLDSRSEVREDGRITVHRHSKYLNAVQRGKNG